MRSPRFFDEPQTRPSSRIRRLPALWTLGLAAALLVPTSASAGSGIYAQLGLGYGKLSGSSLVVQEVVGSADVPVESGSPGCCPDGGFAFDLRAGLSFLGLLGPEVAVIGNAWAFGTDSKGGAGFAGGGVRFWPLGLVELAMDDGEFDFPLAFSLGVAGGYAITGKDFAFTGTFFGFDGTIEYKVADFLLLGAKANYFVPSYDGFAFTDFGSGIGRCLDSSGEQVVPSGDAVHKKGEEVCSGAGPSATFFSPELVVTFKLDVF